MAARTDGSASCNDAMDVVPRMSEAVPAQVVDELYRSFADVRRAYHVDGMSVNELDSFGTTVRTLRGFTSSHQELVATVRDPYAPEPRRQWRQTAERRQRGDEGEPIDRRLDTRDCAAYPGALGTFPLRRDAQRR